MKCHLCESKIEETFLEKPIGTIVKIKKGEKREVYHICPGCQRQHGKDLKKKLEEI